MKIEEEEVEVHLFCFVHLFIVSGSVYRAFKEEGTTSIFHRLSVIKMKKVNFEDLIPKVSIMSHSFSFLTIHSTIGFNLQNPC